MADVKPRADDEKCEYCYRSRVFIAQKVSSSRGAWAGVYSTFEKEMWSVSCICGPTQSCRDPICEYSKTKRKVK